MTHEHTAPTADRKRSSKRVNLTTRDKLALLTKAKERLTKLQAQLDELLKQII